MAKPYKVEYALTGLTNCWGCTKTIEKNVLRFVKSSNSDHMYHFSCFFRELKPRSVDEIAQVAWLHKVDREKIHSQFDVHKMVTRSQIKPRRTFLLDFKVDRTKSSLSCCDSCKKKIPRDNIRISKKVIMKFLDDDEDPYNYYHLECFAKCKEDLDFFENAEKLPGFDEMGNGDQEKIQKMMTDTQSDSEDDDPSLMSNNADLLKMQDNSILKYRSLLTGLSNSELDCLLKFNGQETTNVRERKLDLLSDSINFGALERCDACGGQLLFKDGVGYQCTGISSWSKCNIVIHKPPRKAFKIPTDLSKDYVFLAQYHERLDDRLYVVDSPPKPVGITSDENSETKDVVNNAPKRKNTSKNSVPKKKSLDPSYKIYEDENGTYSSVLSLTDVQTGRNSFYKIQLLFDKHNFFVKRSWGKIGTDCGKGLTEKMPDIESAKKKFYQLFNKKTGNQWLDRANFVKKPNLMYPMDIDESEEEIMYSEPLSKLSKSLQELISMIFNVDVMTKVMITNELDLTKMPLGKLSRTQILKAFAVLAELKQEKRYLIDRFAIDASNQFFTLIPHSFRRGPPPILNSEKLIDSKFNMLEELLEIETAYAMMKESRVNRDGKTNSKDIHYNILGCDIEVLDKYCEEFQMVLNYAYNNNSPFHGYTGLRIIDIFKIKRKGEDEKYRKKYKDMCNKMLLWHGSRVTNFAGILSQGLRIAPPEAPSTGYMFGKGIYFADMISKSASYCASQDEGLILLCEVALGNMYTKTSGEYVTKLPEGKNSTKGLGIINPDASGSKIVNDVTIPCGEIMKTNLITCLLHNEYVVYDVDQVKIQYLLRLKLR